MKLLLKFFITTSLIFSYVLSQAQIPDTQSSLGISYISGGVGEEESKSMLVEAKQWPLMLELSQLKSGRGIWIFGAAIKILNTKQKLIFDTQAEGPYILINLNAGDYLIEATYEGVVQKRAIHIKSDEPQKISIFWK